MISSRFVKLGVFAIAATALAVVVMLSVAPAGGAAPVMAQVDLSDACVRDAANLPALNCTANDVRIARFIPPSGVTTCDPGETIELTLTAELLSTSKERYDIGLFVGENGENALTGNQCERDYLSIPPSSSLETDANDFCGDIAQRSTQFTDVENVSLKCQDTDNDGFVDVSACTSWDNVKNNSPSCQTELNTAPNTPSKCNCGIVPVGITINQTATIEVIKDLIPSTDPGLFNLQIDGTTQVANVGDGGTTGPISVSAGTQSNPGADHTVGETAGTSTSLSNYNSSISCIDEDGDTFSGTGAGPLTVSVDPGDAMVCTITNTRKTGAILVTKTRKHAAGGSGDQPHPSVTFTVNGSTGATNSSGQVCFDGLAFGTYSVVETVPSGYVADGTTSKSVTVDNEASCSDATFIGETVSFSNTPLTNITVSVDSQVDGGTASTISCVNSSSTEIASGSTGTTGDGSATASNLLPGTYTCTVVVDP